MSEDHHHEQFREFDDERVTSPMQDFTTAQVGLGAVIAIVGLLVTFGLPFLLL